MSKFEFFTIFYYYIHMFDIKLAREEPKKVQQNAINKGYKNLKIENLLDLDEKFREKLAEAEDFREKRNQNVAEIKKIGKPTPELIATGKEIKENLAIVEGELEVRENDFIAELKLWPNMARDDVPVGLTEDENVVEKTVGEIPAFDFPVKNHAEIAETKGWLDSERAVRTAGSRFLYIKGDLARLEFALWQFIISTLSDPAKIREIRETLPDEIRGEVSEKPFIFTLPPAVAKTDVFEATGRLNKTEQTYKLEEEDLWLNASAEHTLSPMYIGEILSENDLPLRYLGYTTAFRREAGTYGKDMVGMMRLHQFNKMEMEVFCTKEQSWSEHLFMIAVEEYIMNALELPYRVLRKCTFDIGRPNASGVDIEAWMPGQNDSKGAYRETHTADFIGDFQTRAMKTRVRRADGTVELANTNDATASSERPLIAIIENNQTAEGNVVIPKVLRQFMGGAEEI